jgi:hypothetical protein
LEDFPHAFLHAFFSSAHKDLHLCSLMQVFFQDNLHFFAAAKVAKVVHVEVFFLQERLQKSVHPCLHFLSLQSMALRQAFLHDDLQRFLGSMVVVVTVVGGGVVGAALAQDALLFSKALTSSGSNPRSKTSTESMQPVNLLCVPPAVAASGAIGSTPT